MIALLLIIIGTLFLQGMIGKFRSVLSGRRGYRFLQPLYSVGVLFQKQSTYTTASGIVSRCVAPVYLGLMIVVGMMMPVGGEFKSLLNFNGDVVVFCVLISISGFVLVMGAVDSGGGFASLAAIRQSLYALLLEPSMLLLFATFSITTNNYSLDAIFANFHNVSLPLFVLSLVVGYGFLKLAFVECGRVPVDDPNTHLELTMVHESAVLEFSGIDLAFIRIGGWIKLSVFSLLVVNSLMPEGIQGWKLLVYSIGGMVGFAITIALVESLLARESMNKNIIYCATIFVIALLAFIFAMLLNYGYIL